MKKLPFRSQNASKNSQQQFQGHSTIQGEGHTRFGGEVEYYNDLPGKSPPEFSTINTVQSQQGVVPDTGVSAHVRDRGTGFSQRPFRGKILINKGQLYRR